MGNANSSVMYKGLSDKDLLALSVQEGHSDSIPLFLKKNPSMLQLQFHNRNSLLHIAAQKGHAKALDAILKTAKEGLLNGPTTSGDVISKLLNQQNKDGKTALAIACTKGSADCVRCLVSYGADVWVGDHYGRTCLHHAALRGHSECVRILLEKYQTALQLSVEDEAEDSPTKDGSPGASPTSASSRKSDHPGHKALQQTAASRYANVKDSSGITPLHCAAWSGDVETAVTLLRGGAFLAMQTTGDCYDKEITCNAGSTPLHIAALKGESEMVTMMLCDYVSNCRDGHMHVDPRAITDAYSFTPHQLAASREHQDVAALLNPMTLIGDMVRNNKGATRGRQREVGKSNDGSKDQNSTSGVPAAPPTKMLKDRPAINSLLSMSSEAADFIALLASTSSSSAPDWFVCPITGQVFTDPVVASDGFTYEREAVTARLQSGNQFSPVNDQLLTSSLVFPNTVLYLAIKEWQLHMQRATSSPIANGKDEDNTDTSSVPLGS